MNVLLLVLSVILMRSDVFVPTEPVKAPLVGLKEGVLVVKDFPEEGSVDRERLRLSFQAAIEDAGIQLFPIEDVSMKPTLYVTLDTKRVEGNVAYLMTFEVLEWIDLKRSGDGRLSACVWRRFDYGVLRTSEVELGLLKSAETLSSGFLSSYRAANPDAGGA